MWECFYSITLLQLDVLHLMKKREKKRMKEIKKERKKEGRKSNITLLPCNHEHMP